MKRVINQNALNCTYQCKKGGQKVVFLSAKQRVLPWQLRVRNEYDLEIRAINITWRYLLSYVPSNEPPYSSVRTLLIGDKNEWIKYP
jgi:hypothetical protein